MLRGMRICLLSLFAIGVLFFNPIMSSAQSTIKIGILGAMTGPGSLMGQGMRDGALLYFDQINKSGGISGKKIKAVVMDDQAQISTGINAVKKLIYKDQVIAVIGTANSPVCLATMDITEREKTPQLLFGVAPKITEKNNKWFVAITPSDVILANNLVDYIVKNLGLKKLAILHDSSDYGKGGMSAVTARMKKHKIKPIGVESFNVGDKDFAGQLNKIKSKNVDGIVVWGLYVETAQILAQAKQYGINKPTFLSSGVLQGAFLELAGKAAENAYIVTYFSTDNPDAKVQSFIRNYKNMFNRMPTPTSALAYDAATLLVDAIKEGGTDKNAIMAKLRATKGKSGVIGRLDCDARGQVGQGAVILQVKNGKTKVIKAIE